MGLFEGMLKGDESLFLDAMALDFDYQPKRVPHRDNQQHHIAQCIKPLFANRNGKNLIISGLPGVGKTVCLKHVLRELKQETDRIQFNDIDKAIGTDNKIEDVAAPKTVERLEQISQERAKARKMEEEDEEEEDKLKIGEKIKLTDLDVHDLEKPKETNKVPIGLEEIEILT